MGFNNNLDLPSDVLPRAIRKYGGSTPSAAQGRLDTDIPPGGTLQATA